MDRSLQDVKFVVRQPGDFWPENTAVWSSYFWLRRKTLYRLHSDLNPMRSHIVLEGLDQTAAVA